MKDQGIHFSAFAERALRALQMATFMLCPCLSFLLCLCGQREFSSVSSSSYKDTDLIGLIPHPYDLI